MGTPTATAKPLPAAPGPAEDPFQALVKNRQAAMVRIAARRGVGSTFLTTPAPGTSSLLGGGT
jgi:hypothetical protein